MGAAQVASKRERELLGVVKPHGLLGLVSSRHYCPSTPSLSTWSSTRGLQRPCGLGGVILETASRFYAFSGYPDRTWLPGDAAGATTGTPEVRPPRASRTRGSTPPSSCAHGG